LGTVRSRDWIARADLRAFVQGVRLDFPFDSTTPPDIRPDDDLVAGLAATMALDSGRSAGPGFSRWLKRGCGAALGVGFRYSRTNLYLPEFQHYYLLDSNLEVIKDLAWPRSPDRGFGPMYWGALSLDLGQEHWNRIDWTNHSTHGIGLGLTLGTTSARDSGGWIQKARLHVRAARLWRWYLDRGSFVPGYRPQGDTVLEARFDLAIGVLR
jgi:hypothetical protein